MPKFSLAGQWRSRASRAHGFIPMLHPLTTGYFLMTHVEVVSLQLSSPTTGTSVTKDTWEILLKIFNSLLKYSN